MQQKKDVIKVFSKNKHKYVTSDTHARGSDLSLIEKWITSEQHATALDIATGGGHVARVLSRHCNNVFATDLTRDMLDHTANYFTDDENVHFMVADAENLPFIDQSFDIVTCRIAAHHFPHPEKFIKEVYRVLKPQGIFIFIDNIASEHPSYDIFINTVEKLRDYSHARALKISEWKQLFAANNLCISKEFMQKKPLHYKEWINRTLDCDEEIEFISHLLLNASSHIKRYYQIKIDNEKILSFAIDEWIVLSKKEAGTKVI